MSEAAGGAFLEFEIDGVNRQFDLSTICLIGRSNNSNLILTGEMVSRQHAMLQRSASGQFYITDLGSSNGTFVNGTRIAVPAILSPGDEIAIGVHKLVLRQEIDTRAETQAKCEMQMTSVLVEQKLITVLVADIRNFTGMAQRLDAGTLARATGSLFRESGKLLQERGVWAQKYIGDAVMAVWQHRGWTPEPDEYVVIFDALCKLAKTAGRLQSQFQLAERVRFGAGLNTGLASVGNVGSAASSDYTALGDVVNKAFRLEAATRGEQCDLLVGKDAYAWLKSMEGPSAVFEPRSLVLKGYVELETAYSACLPDVEQFLSAHGVKNGKG